MEYRNNIRSLMDKLWSFGGGWAGYIVSCGLALVAIAYFFLFFVMLIRGEPWAFIIYAENPYAHLLGGLIFLGGFNYVRYGYRDGALFWKQFAGKLFLLFFILFISFVAGEIGLRKILKSRQDANSIEHLKDFKKNAADMKIRSDHPLVEIIEPSDHESIVYELQPNLTMDFGEKSLRTNQRGMRSSREYTVERLPNSIRILGLGDSGMFGWNVEQGQNYMDVLEKRLNARGGTNTYEVLNLAVPGYNSEIESEVLKYKGLQYQPDIVIVGWCENDGQLPFFLLEKEDFTRRDVSFLHMLLFKREDFRYVASGEQIKSLRDYDRKLISPDILNGIEAAGLEKAFRSFKQLTDEHHIKLLFFGPIGKGVRDLLDTIGITYYNTYVKVDKSAYPEKWAVHFMHPTAEGHDVLARHLEKDLQDLGWITPASITTEVTELR